MIWCFISFDMIIKFSKQACCKVLLLHIDIANVSLQMFHRPSMGPPPEEKAHGSISTKTYVRFFRAGANYLALLMVLLSFFIGEVYIYNIQYHVQWPCITTYLLSFAVIGFCCNIRLVVVGLVSNHVLL